jgi:hypothetical protein
MTAFDFHALSSFNSTKLTPMAASLYIVVEGEDPGFDIFVNGQALARNEDALEQLEEGAANPNQTRALPRPQWFSALSGLLTIRALIDFLTAHPAALGSETQAVLMELCEYERVLRKTAERKLNWHLAVSWR